MIQIQYTCTYIVELVGGNPNNLEISTKLLLEGVQSKELWGVITVGGYIHHQNHLAAKIREIDGASFENVG